MGSGEFPELGFRRAAYAHNIVYYDANTHHRDFHRSWITVSDPSRYYIEPGEAG
ncbi:hypothetical protein F4803DRAFT_517830 [Xylaria telfairii]|nr:hypothetical protein F4803DRAFT_517830 [Xylaria telfairii]